MSDELVMPFDTDDREFTRGFQMGVIWAMTEPNRDEQHGFMVYADNTEMLMRMQERGREFTVTERGYDWLEVLWDFQHGV